MVYGRDECKIESLYVKLQYKCEQTTQKVFCMIVRTVLHEALQTEMKIIFITANISHSRAT